MIPNPLHPAIVHFPIVFAVLLPIVAVAALWAIRRGTPVRRAWLFPLVLAAALSVSAFVAVKSGQAQADRVENVVGEGAVHGHEEAAELFLVLSGVLLAVVAVGLAPGVAGRAARTVATLAALGLLAAGYRVGASGGDLVYRHGAASVYALQTGVAPQSSNAPTGESREAREGHDGR
jgi:uncharacterized membrane protein